MMPALPTAPWGAPTVGAPSSRTTAELVEPGADEPGAESFADILDLVAPIPALPMAFLPPAVLPTAPSAATTPVDASTLGEAQWSGLSPLPLGVSVTVLEVSTPFLSVPDDAVFVPLAAEPRERLPLVATNEPVVSDATSAQRDPTGSAAAEAPPPGEAPVGEDTILMTEEDPLSDGDGDEPSHDGGSARHDANQDSTYGSMIHQDVSYLEGHDASGDASVEPAESAAAVDPGILPARLRLAVEDVLGAWEMDLHRHAGVMDLVLRGDSALESVVAASREDLERAVASAGDRAGSVRWESVGTLEGASLQSGFSGEGERGSFERWRSLVETPTARRPADPANQVTSPTLPPGPEAGRLLHRML